MFELDQDERLVLSFLMRPVFIKEDKGEDT